MLIEVGFLTEVPVCSGNNISRFNTTNTIPVNLIHDGDSVWSLTLIHDHVFNNIKEGGVLLIIEEVARKTGLEKGINVACST